MILANTSDNSFGLLNMSTLENVKYKNIKIEITNQFIMFYCMSDYRVFYKYQYNIKYYDDQLDLYRALMAFDEKIISDIIDPLNELNENKLIELSNNINEMLRYMSSWYFLNLFDIYIIWNVEV